MGTNSKNWTNSCCNSRWHWNSHKYNLYSFCNTSPKKNMFALCSCNNNPIRKYSKSFENFAHKKSGNKLVDIGSGDGRIVHLAAQNGYKAHGIELNPWLVMYSKYRSLRLGIRSTTTFSRQDLWKSNF